MSETPESRAEPRDGAVLYAAGLGVLLSSPGALAALPEGRDHLAAIEAKAASPAARLVHAQELVLLGTGSPQLSYRFLVHLRVPTPRETEHAASRTRFGCVVGEGGLVVRDGYDLMEWTGQTSYELRLPVAPGSYDVTALWLASVPHGDADMVVGLFLEPVGRPMRGDGWPVLPFRVDAETA